VSSSLLLRKPLAGVPPAFHGAGWISENAGAPSLQVVGERLYRSLLDLDLIRPAAECAGCGGERGETHEK
ncbi:hypothetical protein PFISCL1PPCAC_22674, partial [Pristionchus fissidentatus]